MVETISFLASNANSIFAGSIAYFMLLWLALVIWTANDLSRRPGTLKMKVFSLALVIVGNIFGFVVYLVIRPHETYEEKIQSDLERKLVESQINNLYCRACEFPVKEDFIVCPNCLKKLKNVCTNCKNLLEVNWLACPYCSYSQITLPAAAEDKSKVESRSEMKKRGRGNTNY